MFKCSSFLSEEEQQRASSRIDHVGESSLRLGEERFLRRGVRAHRVQLPRDTSQILVKYCSLFLFLLSPSSLQASYTKV